MTPDEETRMPNEGIAAQIKAEREARETIRRAGCRADYHAPARSVRSPGRLVAVVAWCECGAVKWQPEIVDGANL